MQGWMESPENGTEWSPVGGGVVGFIHHLSSSAGLYFPPLFSPRCHTPMRAHPGALIFATQTSAAAKESQSLAGRINDSKCSPSADLKVTPKFFCRQGSAEGARETSVYCALPFAVTQRSRTHTELESRWELTQSSDSDCLEPKTKYLPAATWPGKTVETDQVQLWWPRWILFIVNKNTPKRSSSLSVRSAQNFNESISYNLWLVVWGYCIHSITVSAHSHWDDKVMMITQQAINVSRGSAPTGLQWKIWCQLEGKLTFFF